MIPSLSRDRAALLVVDVQERLAAAMSEEMRGQLYRNTTLLLETARLLGLPVVVTQQYPKGLGPTVDVVAKALPPGTHRLDKLEFSAAANPDLQALVPRLGRDQWILAGMETHVCVYQTARGMVERGYQVHVAIDAACSRTKQNWRIGQDLIGRAGAVVTSTETVVFDLLGRAGTEEFKALSRLIK